MTTTPRSPATLSDPELLAEVRTLAQRERLATAQLIAVLAEFDRRGLYLGEGCSSLFTYCTQVLKLSEHAAYGRIEAARAARRIPIVLDLLADGSVTLTTVGLLAPHLTSDNSNDLLSAARHKSKREVEHLVANLAPRAAIPASVRRLPAPKSAGLPRAQPSIAAISDDETASTPRLAPAKKHPAVVAPLAPERYKVQFTASRETYEKLRRAQDLLRHEIPDGDPAAIFDRALTLLLSHLEKTKLAHTRRPRARRPATNGSRVIPAAVRREVWARDEGRCAFVGPEGRCAEHGFLEFHHVLPYAVGGKAVADNIQLRCRAHNAYEAAAYFDPQRLLLREGPSPRYMPTFNSVRTECVPAPDLRREVHIC